MAGLINELMDVLSDMSAIVHELVDIAVQKKDVIIRNDVAALKDFTARENTLVGRCQRAERARTSIIKDIAIVLNEKEKNLTLSGLGEIIKGQEEYETYTEIARVLTDKLRTLRELNEQNGVLIENALEYIDFSVNVIRSTFSDDSFMDDKQRLGDGKGFLDTKN